MNITGSAESTSFIKSNNLGEPCLYQSIFCELDLHNPNMLPEVNWIASSETCVKCTLCEYKYKICIKSNVKPTNRSKASKFQNQ